MSRIWGNREANSGVMQSHEDPTMFVFGDLGVGDMIRVPPEVKEIGGMTVQVQDIAAGICPMCNVSLIPIFLFGRVQEERPERDWRMGECPNCGYVWHAIRPKEKTKEE